MGRPRVGEMTARTRTGKVSPEDPPRSSNAARVVVAIFATGPADPWSVTLSSLRQVAPDIPVVVGSTLSETVNDFEQPGVETRNAATPAALVNDIYRTEECHVLLITAPVVLPPCPLITAVDLAASDLRCASVAFLCNAAAFLSFPHRDAPSIHQINDLDEVSITRNLRSRSHELGACPLPYATGPAVLLTSQGLSVVGPFPDHGPVAPELALADYSCRARAHGMVDLLDPSTFVLRPRDVVSDFPNNTWLAPSEESWLASRYPGMGMLLTEPAERDGALGDVIRAARAAALGVRVVIDGSCIGPNEMGTQVTLLALVKALADRSDVESLGVALAGPVPAYAEKVLSHSKIRVGRAPDGDFSEFGIVDVVHRPFQAAPDTDVAAWRRTCSRTLMTVHDVIAYQVPGYHRTPADWIAYRVGMRDTAREVDGIIVISTDVQRQLHLERFPIDRERVFTVANGVDHLTGHEPEACPDELLQRGFSAAAPFLLVLGTDYAHKNRDKAIDVLSALRKTGHALELVLVGAHVPYGSSRAAEASSLSLDLPVHVIPDVSSEERNWLLRHAAVVLYPTSAEGFGLIPHEAAAFGTPTVLVPFGPLGERFPALPVAPRDWSTAELTAATESLLRDPALAQAQVDTLARDTERYDWSLTAAKVVDVYRALLARPARRPQIS